MEQSIKPCQKVSKKSSPINQLWQWQLTAQDRPWIPWPFGHFTKSEQSTENKIRMTV